MGVRLGWSLVSALIIACDPSGDEPVELRDNYCPQFRCGFNSAEVNGRSLRELNLDGLANSDGIRIVAVTPPLTLLLQGYTTLGLDGDELVLKRGNGATARGSALVGTVIAVAGTGLTQTVALTLLGYDHVDSWNSAAPPASAYAFVYAGLDGVGQKNVCTGTLVDQLAKAATLIGGETYDLAAKTVQAGRSRWFTIACAGSAAAKVKLLGYSPNTPLPGGPAAVDRRQATLKMITADYCGEGQSYTANGTPLAWENAPGTVSLPTGLDADLEAVWTGDGAICLETHRIAGVEVGCELPGCEGLDLGDGEWRTWVPR